MIVEIAAAAMITCVEANQIANRIDLTKFPPVYVTELVTQLKAAAPSGCLLITDHSSR